jgi:uncharacterized protein (DUF433 family)
MLKDIPADDLRRRTGLFNLSQAAKYLAINRRTLTSWASQTPKAAPPVVTAFPVEGREVLVPFVGFAEAFALTALRKAGVSMQKIRPAVADLQREVGLEHALASKDLATDGVEVLFKYAGDDPDHTVVNTKQKQFRKAVEEYLRPIHYGQDGFADELWLPAYGEREVFVNPKRAWGQPLLKGGRATVEDIADRFTAGETVEDIAFDFRISPEQVERVIRVEALASRGSTP